MLQYNEDEVMTQFNAEECIELLRKQENIDPGLWGSIIVNPNVNEDVLMALLNITPNDSDYMECMVRHEAANVTVFQEILNNKRYDESINSLVLITMANHHNADVDTLINILRKQKALNLRNIEVLNAIVNNSSTDKNVLVATLEAINLHLYFSNKITTTISLYINLLALIVAHPAADLEIFMEILTSPSQDVINDKVLENIIKHPSIDVEALIQILNQVISANKSLCKYAVGNNYYSVSSNYILALKLIIKNTKSTTKVMELVLDQILHDINLLGNKDYLIDLLKMITEQASADTLQILLNKFFATNTLFNDKYVMNILLNKVIANSAATSEILHQLLTYFKDIQDIGNVQRISQLVENRNATAKSRLMPLLYSRLPDGSAFCEKDDGNLAFTVMQYHSFGDSRLILASDGKLKPFKN